MAHGYSGSYPQENMSTLTHTTQTHIQSEAPTAPNGPTNHVEKTDMVPVTPSAEVPIVATGAPRPSTSLMMWRQATLPTTSRPREPDKQHQRVSQPIALRIAKPPTRKKTSENRKRGFGQLKWTNFLMCSSRNSLSVSRSGIKC